MAIENQGAASFINGLSDLWLRFFKDKDTLKALYRGTEITLGQAYLELLSSVLNISVRETPVFNRELFKLLTIREDQIIYDPAIDRFVFALQGNLKSFQYLYNRVLEPTVILETPRDFAVDIAGTADTLNFKFNPFDLQTLTLDPADADKVYDGIPYRTIDVLQDDGTVVARRQIALWVPDALSDEFNLYLTYGYMVNRFEPSTEAYRALIQGIMHYFTQGPATRHIVGALNTLIGLPLVKTEGETLQSIVRTDPLSTVVKTDRNDYAFDPRVPIRADIEDTANWGTLTLALLDPISDVFAVRDAISDPTWWYDLIIPTFLLPDEPLSRRSVTTEMFDNVIDNPTGLIEIGDPGFIIGADDDGYIPTGRPGKRHTFAYILFERFLKHHILKVDIDDTAFMTGAVPFPRSREDLQEVILAGKSAYTYLYFEPDIPLEDFFSAEELLTVTPQVGLENILGGLDNALMIGTRSWQIGDGFEYQPDGTIHIENDNPAFTPVAIANIDPSHLTTRIAWDEGVNFAVVTGISGFEHECLLTVPDSVFQPYDLGRFVTIGTDSAYREVLEVYDYSVITLGVAATVSPVESDIGKIVQGMYSHNRAVLLSYEIGFWYLRPLSASDTFSIEASSGGTATDVFVEDGTGEGACSSASTESFTGRQVRLDGGLIGADLTWALWELADQAEGAGIIDWPVQVHTT